MTTPSTERKAGPLLGTGVQTTWPFTFKVFAATDIAVTIADSLGVETALVYGVDYTVSLNANQETSPGGTVTYPISGSPLPTGSRLVIVGNLPYDQPLDLPAGGNFSPLAIENELDRLTMQIQQLRENIGRALQVSVSTGANVGLPAPSANELIGWDSTGANLQNFALSELATAVAYATMRYDTFTGDGVETQFTLTADPVTLANLDVAISGVTQVPGSDYFLVSGVLVFASAPANGTEILARYGEGLVNVGGDSSDIRFLQSGIGAVARTVQSKLREVVSAADFGADVAGDVTTQLQAALDRAEDGILLLTPGHTYAISATLYPKHGCTIEGNGATLLNNITGVGNPLQIRESNVTVQNLTIENTANNPVYTIADPSYAGGDIFINSIATTVKNIVLRNITTVNSIEYAAAISGNGDCENVLIENCTVNGGKWVDCFAFEWNYRGGTAPANIIVPKNIEFVNCKALNNNQLAGTSWNWGWWISTCINVKLTNCIADYCKNGVALICGDVGSTPVKERMTYSLENCEFVNTVYYGLDTFYPNTVASPNDRFLISARNCYFSGYQQSDSDSLGYSLRSCAGSVVIDGCEFERMYRAIRMGSFGGAGLEDVKNVKIINCTFDQIYNAPIIGNGVQDSVIAHNQFNNICIGSTANAADSAIYLTYQSDRNVITGNSFGIGLFTPRFYVTLQPAGTPSLKIPTGNIIANNTFLRQTAGLFNVINNNSAQDYLCENIVSNNISLAGASQGMVSGAVHFSNEGGAKVAHDNTAPVAGTFAVGDKCWNTAPSAGGTPGWVCTTGGTPGTWKAMANVAS